MKSVLLALSIPVILFSLSAHAEKQLFVIEDFQELVVTEGVKATLACAEQSAVEVKIISAKKRRDLENLAEEKGKLTLEDIFASSPGSMTIYTSKPVNSIYASKGVSLNVDGCAISNEILSVTGRMGTKINVSGKTKRLNLALSTGSSFNNDVSQFDVNVANVSLTAGVKAKLCNTRAITGELRLGSEIHVGSQTVNKTTGGASTNEKPCL